jgi:deazaflavin-dependent oxidoreductase (nitroreductase family)
MPLPHALTDFNRRLLNPFTLRLAGTGSFVDLEHVGRTTGTVRHTPLMAFRDGDVVTIALTYGSGVQWLRNVEAAGRCRMTIGRSVLDLGAPRRVPSETALPRISQPQRTLLRWPIRCSEFVELPVLAEHAR